ncbi:death-inducer obliterator 1 [Polymixia lowei]
MEASLDTVQNNSTAGDNTSEEPQGDPEQQQQSLLEGTDRSARPSLSEFKKSWGFRQTTIARREFMDEIIDLDPSPPPMRRGRSRRAKQTPQTTPDTHTTQRPSRASRSVIDDLEWSAPSSPVSVDTEPAPEAGTGGSLDPSLWQDFGSAFHTAFSLLGGKEGMSMEMPDVLAAPVNLEATDDMGTPTIIETTDESDIVEATGNLDTLQCVDAPNDVEVGERDDVLLISSREEDSDDLTLMQLKERLASKGKQEDARGRPGRGGKGKPRGRGRGRGRGKRRGRGRGRGRGRAAELESSTADDEGEEEDVILVNQAEQQQLQEEEKESSPERMEVTEVSQSPAQLSNSDCIIIERDLEPAPGGTPGQYDDAPEEEEEMEVDKNQEEYSSISDSEGYDPNALYCICRQKHNKRFMISCDRCQEWFHGDCVGISEAQGRKMERKGQEYICPSCTTKKRNKLQPDPHPQTEPHTSLPECPNTTPSDQKEEEATEQQAVKEAAAKKEELKTEPEPDAEMETDSSLPLCIGPGCSKHALPDSVYCGTDCILQHAAFTMKSMSGPKEPKSRGRLQRKAATPKPTAKGQRSVKVSQRSAGQPEEEEEEEKQGDGRQEEAISPVAGDPSLTAVQATSIPSSKLCTSSDMDSEQVEAKSEPVTPLTQAAEEPSTAASPSSGPVTKPPPLQGNAQDKAKKSFNSGGVSKKESLESAPPLPTTSSKSSLPSAPETPSTSASRHHESGALKVTKTSFVIPKKQPGSRPPPSHVPASPSGLPPSSAPTLLNETRNLPVSPAPIAPSSRPSQPNNQVRQSIQRSLTSILFKRVCDCDDLEMSESEVGKLVTSIEMEMFDIFRNTDSKYMNKYRTIMFNLKDPRNKGLLYRVVRGEISSFRLARMSQRDMQATKLPEPSIKETTEVKEPAAKAPCLLQKPDTVKVDLPSLSLNTSRSDRTTEQKRSLPPALKTRPSQPSQNSSVPDILSCMLKDTTSEHKTHLFDLKCKICTGQIPAEEEEEPVQKKLKVSESRDKREYGHSFYSSPAERSWRGSGGDDSPLRAPPDSPDMNSPTSLLMESPRLIIDTPALSIMESPASPVVDSPASPILESPASPVMESPASPTPDTPKAKTSVRSYTPVVIPAHSTVTISRRDPRTAASRSSSLSTGTSGPTNTAQSQGAPYGTVKDTISAPPLPPPMSLPPSSILPKSILMKPSSSADPRLYGASSRTMNSHSPADGETAQFLAKQDILWKGFLNMLSVAKFVTKGYLVSGSAENLKADLPDTIQIGGRIMPQTVWDYVAKLKTSVTKELCVIRFHPATEEEEVAYVSLFSYFSSRGRFGVVANNSRSIKDIYLVPLSAKEAIPSKLQPFDGPGLEKNRPNLLLGLAIIQRPKRPGILLQENEEKRPKVHMSKDPMWIPKPPVLYGSDRLEIFQPYDPETPINTTPPGSPPSTGSPSDSSSSGSITIPTLLTSTRETPPVSSSAPAPATPSTSNTVSDKNPTTTSTDNTTDNTPLQTILKTLFGNKPSDSVAPAESSSTITTVGAVKLPKPPQVPQPMVDPIVQQYGQKSKVKEIEEEENEYDRPYDPEEEYDPAMGYVMVAPHSLEKIKTDAPAPPSFGEDDVAYDPEDDTIFEDMQNEAVRTKALASVQGSAPMPCPVPTSTQVPTPVPTPASDQTSTTTPVLQNLPTGTVVVSAATLTEQQRMLEELNKQIEEQKRQLKEQEEALRQQREAVGMFMAHFSVSDSLMSPPSKSLPLSQINSQQSDVEQSESKPSESTDKMNDLTKPLDNQSLLQIHIMAGDIGNRQRGKVVETGTAVELLQEGLSGAPLRILGGGRKGTDTEEVKGTGQGIELGTSLNAKGVIAETVPRDGILVDQEHLQDPPVNEILSPFHQDGKGDLLLRSFRDQNINVL